MRKNFEKLTSQIETKKLEEKLLKDRVAEEKVNMSKISQELEKTQRNNTQLTQTCDQRMSRIRELSERVHGLDAEEKSLVECVKRCQIKCIDLEKVKY